MKRYQDKQYARERAREIGTKRALIDLITSLTFDYTKEYVESCDKISLLLTAKSLIEKQVKAEKALQIASK